MQRQHRERISAGRARVAARLSVTGGWGISHLHVLPDGVLSERRFATDQRSASLARRAERTNIGRSLHTPRGRSKGARA